MQTFPSSETVLLASNSPPLGLGNSGGDDVDIDFRDVFGGPPKRRSKVHNEVSRHSFSETALQRPDVDGGGALISRDDAFWNDGRDEKPVFGEEPSNRRRFTTDDFFDDIFRLNEKKTNERESKPFGSWSSLPGSRILSPARPVPHKHESPGTSFPAQFSLPAKLIKAKESPTFGSATRSLSKSKETASSSPLSRTSSKVEMASTVKSDSDAPEVVVTGKGRQFHFSIYKWPNKGVPVVIWGSSRLSSMTKAEETTTTTTPSVSRSTSVEKSGKNAEGEGESSLYGLKEENKTSQTEEKKEIDSMWFESGLKDGKKTLHKRPGVQPEEEKTEIDSVSEQAFSGDVKPRHSFLDDKDNRQGEEIVSEREVPRKGKSKAKNTRSSAGESRSKEKPQGRRSSLDSPIPDKSSFASSSSSATEVGKDGVKGKVMDFVKIFSQGGESLGQSSRWRARENLGTDINKDGANNAKETVKLPDQQKKSAPDNPTMATQKKDSDQESVNIHDQQKKSTLDIPTMDQNQKPSQAATQRRDSYLERVKNNKAPGVTKQEERQEPSRAHTTSEDADEPIHINFQVEEITQGENKMEETGNDAQEFQNIDAKIRKWSSGKTGNIRSLLSTLQYILWARSGWKAVPLMDLIEGNAVRKSYQRALLILHPDKLQQKGASANQKYMAEKVFELLQDL